MQRKSLKQINELAAGSLRSELYYHPVCQHFHSNKLIAVYLIGWNLYKVRHKFQKGMEANASCVISNWIYI